MLASDMRDVIAKMNALKSHGVRLSLDDIGTGYSSLSYLKHLPLEKSKTPCVSWSGDVAFAKRSGSCGGWVTGHGGKS